MGARDNFPLAKAILTVLEKKGKLDKADLIDVEKSQASSYGEREVVIRYEGVYIRLDPDRWEEGLDRFFKLNSRKARIVDLRLPNLALILPKEKEHERTD